MGKSKKLIEELREQLNSAVQDTDNHENAEVLELSRELDEVINQYTEEMNQQMPKDAETPAKGEL